MKTLFSVAALSGAVLAGLAATLLTASTPAEARKSACLARYHACDRRCAASYDAAGWVRCHHRTCGPQYDRCAANGLVAPTKQAGSDGRSTDGKGPFTPRPPRGTGPFVPDGAKPKQNGGIVPGGMRPKAGIPGPMRADIGRR